MVDDPAKGHAGRGEVEKESGSSDLHRRRRVGGWRARVDVNFGRQQSEPFPVPALCCVPSPPASLGPSHRIAAARRILREETERAGVGGGEMKAREGRKGKEIKALAGWQLGLSLKTLKIRSSA